VKCVSKKRAGIGPTSVQSIFMGTNTKGKETTMPTKKKKKKSVSKTGKTAKIEKKEPTLAEAWRDLLQKNEALAKSGKKPLTDSQLTREMERIFPDKKGRTTLTRVGTIRSCYNKGVNLFLRYGPGKPVSHNYKNDGKTKKAKSSKKAFKAPVKKKTKKAKVKKAAKKKKKKVAPK